MDTLIHEGTRWNVVTRTETRVLISRNGETRWIDA